MPDMLVDGGDLAGMSRSSNILQKMGYDPDEVRANPALRAEVLAKVAGPYSAQQTPARAPVEVAQQVTPPPPGTGQRTAVPSGQMLNPKSQNGGDISAPPGQPRLINREQPTVPIPPRSVPSTVGAPPAPTQQSVAGATPTSPSVSPSGTAAPAAPNVDVENARQAATSLLSPEPDLPDTATEDTMISAKSVPINPRTNPKMYKEGGWGKVGRELKAGAVGFLEGGVPGSIAGFADPHRVGEKDPGDPNSNYDIDENTRKAQLALAQSQRATAIDDFKRRADLRKQQDTASHDAGEIANTTAKLPNETTTANADMLRAQDAGNPKNEQEAIAAYGREADPAKKAALWDTVQKMHEATISEMPRAELQEYTTWYRAKTKENHGQPPTSDQIQDYHQKNGSANVPDEVGSIVADAMDAKQKYADNLQRRPDGSYVDKNTRKRISAQEFQDNIEKIGRSDPNVKLAKKGYTIDEQGNLVKHGQSSNMVPASTAPPAPRTPPERPATAPKNYVPFTDSQGNDHWIDPQKLAAAKKRDPGLRTY